jgi:hypothetical protein
MRWLGLGVFGLILLGMVSVRADTWPWPSVGAQSRHGTGIVLLGPIDYDAIRSTGPLEGPLRRAWSDSFTLAQVVEPDLFGYPWADRRAGELVVSVADPRGVEIVNRWVRSGLQVASPKPGGPFTIDLPRPEVTVRIRFVQHSIRDLDRVIDGVIDLVRARVSGADRIYSAGPDPEHDRVIIVTDRLNDELLEAIAARFGVAVIAVRVDPSATSFHLL